MVSKISWLKRSILASCFTLTSLLSTARAENLEERLRAETVDTGVNYSRIYIRSYTNGDPSDEDIKLTGNQVGGTIGLHIIPNLNTSFTLGAQKFSLEYIDPSFREVIRDLNLSLDVDPTIYMGGRVELEIPVNNFVLGPFVYSERAVKASAEIRRFSARSRIYGLHGGNISSIRYSDDRLDAGFYVRWQRQVESFNHRKVGLSAAFAYTKLNFDLEVDYTKQGRMLLNYARIVDPEILEGSFSHNESGGYIHLGPVVQLWDMLFLEANINFIFTEDTRAYQIGGHLEFCVPSS